MTDFSRREILGLLGIAVMGGAFGCTTDSVEKAARSARQATGPFTPKFFTDPEWETVRLLADMTIPKDDRSGSATEAGVPEFMDFMMIDRPSSGERVRTGLAWLDAECRKRFQKGFPDCSATERTAIIDDIAWPKQASPDMKGGVDFFSNFRNLTASGFWSSRMGIEDLRYIGNTFNPGWDGCPAAQMEKLGVKYA